MRAVLILSVSSATGSACNAKSCEMKATNMENLFSILFLYITITSITSTYGESSIFFKTPDIFERTNRFIKIEGRIESRDLPDGEILRHNVEIVFSPLDSRLMLFFKRMDIQYKSSDAKIKIGSEKTKYIFDGELWRYFYRTSGRYSRCSSSFQPLDRRGRFLYQLLCQQFSD